MICTALFCALSKPDHFFNFRINPSSTIDRTLEKWTASQKLITNWRDDDSAGARMRMHGTHRPFREPRAAERSQGGRAPRIHWGETQSRQSAVALGMASGQGCAGHWRTRRKNGGILRRRDPPNDEEAILSRIRKRGAQADTLASALFRHRARHTIARMN
jgi:hypothetical protein